MLKWMMKDWTVYTAEVKCSSLGLFELNATLVYQWLLVSVIYFLLFEKNVIVEEVMKMSCYKEE